jgi:hypothetical protein
MKTMSEKIQLNAKVVPEIKQAVDTIKEKTRFSREEIAEVAYAHLFGSRDKTDSSQARENRDSIQPSWHKSPF